MGDEEKTNAALEDAKFYGARSIQHIVNDRPDSIEIGTPSKGGSVKVYFDASKPEAEQHKLIDAAIKARAYAAQQAGGQA